MNPLNVWSKTILGWIVVSNDFFFLLLFSPSLFNLSFTTVCASFVFLLSPSIYLLCIFFSISHESCSHLLTLHLPLTPPTTSPLTHCHFLLPVFCHLCVFPFLLEDCEFAWTGPLMRSIICQQSQKNWFNIPTQRCKNKCTSLRCSSPLSRGPWGNQRPSVYLLGKLNCLCDMFKSCPKMGAFQVCVRVCASLLRL